jgi:hypothetical protein
MRQLQRDGLDRGGKGSAVICTSPVTESASRTRQSPME